MFAYTLAEFACVCVNICIYVGRVYMSVHEYLHVYTLRLHVCVYVITYMHAESVCVCVCIYA